MERSRVPAFVVVLLLAAVVPVPADRTDDFIRVDSIVHGTAALYLPDR